MIRVVVMMAIAGLALCLLNKPLTRAGATAAFADRNHPSYGCGW